MTNYLVDDPSFAHLPWCFPSLEVEPQRRPVDNPLFEAPSPSLSMDIDSFNFPQVPGLTYTGPDHLLNYGTGAFMTDGVFPLDEEWCMEAFNQPPNVQLFEGSPQNAPGQRPTIDTALLSTPVEPFSPFSPTAAVEIPGNFSQGDPSSLPTPSLASTSFPFSFSPSFVSEGASPHSPLDRRRSSVGSPIDDARESLLEQGYPGNSPIALQRREILRRTILNETSQLPTVARDIKKLADVQRYTDDAPDDALPSSGKKPGSFVLQCAWAGCNHLSSRPDRLKTHIFTHIGFKPFPCDRTCGDPNCTAKFFSKGDCNSHQTRHEKKIYCEICGEESTAKNLTRHTRSTKCKNNGRRNTSYSL